MSIPTLTALDVAERYNLSRQFVYDHSDELGAVRLGEGSKARLRFSPRHVEAYLTGPPLAPVVRETAPRKPPGRKPTGQIIERHGRRGTTYGLRVRVNGARKYVRLGTAAEGWTRARAERELLNVRARIEQHKPPVLNSSEPANQ